jgi:hypothetical protein
MNLNFVAHCYSPGLSMTGTNLRLSSVGRCYSQKLKWMANSLSWRLVEWYLTG